MPEHWPILIALLSFIKEEICSDTALMNLKEKADYSPFPSHALTDNVIALVRPTCFGTTSLH